MNRLNNYTDDELNKLLNKSESLRDFIKMVDYDSSGGQVYIFIRSKLKERNIKIPIFKNKQHKFRKKKTNEEIFVKDSKFSRNHLKRRIIKENLIEYKCSECGLEDEWNGKKLSLQLEHKNGINNDNRLENLTFLCPNCHSQTETYAGKSRKKKYFCECGKEIDRYSNRCKKCRIKAPKKINKSSGNKTSRRKVKRPEYHTLLNEINEFGYTGTGRKYGVSDNAIRKWKKHYENIE